MLENATNEELKLLVDDLSDRLANSFYQNYNILASIVLFTEKYYEGSHSRFVSEKSGMIAKELGMPDEDVMEVKMAGMLHDIGKLAFSDTMLYKHQSEMTDKEMRRYYLYPRLGMQILKSSKNYDNIGKIILQHREKLDGSGFPNNLKKDNILPAARIIGVVDFFHRRIYKRLKSRSSAEKPSVPATSSASYLELTNERYKDTLNFLLKKRGVLYEKEAVDLLFEIMELERKTMGQKSIQKVMVNEIEDGMIFADDYYTDFGLLIAAKGEKVNSGMKKTLLKFAENGNLPNKILVIK